MTHLMTRSLHFKVGRTILHSAFGVLLLGALTFAGYHVHLNLAIAGFLCLIVLVLLSFFASLISAVILSVAAVGLLDFFFAPPILSFQVSDPLNILALAAFLISSLAITSLMARVRSMQAGSERQRKEMKRLYSLAQQLLALTPGEDEQPRLLALFRDVFELRAVCLFEHETAATHIVGEPRSSLEEQTRTGFFSGQDRDDAGCGISVRCLRIAGKTTGALGFEWPDHEEFSPDSLAALEMTMLERVRAFQAATQAVAAAQADSLRMMLLDALAHAVKTPLATILAAVGGLRETGALNPDHLEFVDVVESETAQLNRLTTRLLRIANLDREEVQPCFQQVDLLRLLGEELQLRRQQFADHQLSLLQEMENPVHPVPCVRADPELLCLALAQLIENACKYSQPGSQVEVSTGTHPDAIAIRVRSRSYIPEEERSKIFDRFYRGKQSRATTLGTGLGLDIARRIATAHGGTLALEASTPEASIFCITLPLAIGS
jgi:two-component system, OmpR family, sensor histidine kinase KdpD